METNHILKVIDRITSNKHITPIVQEIKGVKYNDNIADAYKGFKITTIHEDHDKMLRLRFYIEFGELIPTDKDPKFYIGREDNRDLPMNLTSYADSYKVIIVDYKGVEEFKLINPLDPMFHSETDNGLWMNIIEEAVASSYNRLVDELSGKSVTKKELLESSARITTYKPNKRFV